MANEGRYLEEFERDRDALGKVGLDIYAFYLPFHFFPPQSSVIPWGIYILQHGINRLAAFLRSAPGGHLSPHTALELAYTVLHRHELAHYETELFALMAELALDRKLYIPYHRDVYRKEWPERLCVEESLANTAVLKSPALDELVANARRDRLAAVRAFFDRQPPAYQNYRLLPHWLPALKLADWPRLSEARQVRHLLYNQIVTGRAEPGDQHVPFFKFNSSEHFAPPEELVPVTLVPPPNVPDLFLPAPPPKKDVLESLLHKLGSFSAPSSGGAA